MSHFNGDKAFANSRHLSHFSTVVFLKHFLPQDFLGKTSLLARPRALKRTSLGSLHNVFTQKKSSISDWRSCAKHSSGQQLKKCLKKICSFWTICGTITPFFFFFYKIGSNITEFSVSDIIRSVNMTTCHFSCQPPLPELWVCLLRARRNFRHA